MIGGFKIGKKELFLIILVLIALGVIFLLSRIIKIGFILKPM